MKKLFFDDFQQGNGGKYVVEEISVPETAARVEVKRLPIIRTETKPAVPEFHVSDFFDVDSDIYRGDTEPRTEFDFLLNKVLALMKEVYIAHSVVFFWANREKHQLVMEARLTSSQQFMSARRFSIGHDLVSKVALQGKPEVLAEVNPLTEKELIPYYETPVSVRSFAAVPVFFSKNLNETVPEQPIGVIAVDSLEEDAYGPETATSLGLFTKLISALIKSYTDKYDLILESELLASMKRFNESLKIDFSLPMLTQALTEETSKLVKWDCFTIVLYDEAKHAWVVKKVHNRAQVPYVAPEHVIDFAGSIVGQVIKNNLPFIEADVQNVTLPRYSEEEKVEMKGAILCVPLSTANKCYGAIVVESKECGTYSRKDMETIKRLSELAASALEIFLLNEVIKEYVIIDEATGAYSKKFCIQRIEEELQRADDSGTELSLLLVNVDQHQSLLQRFGKEGVDRVMHTVVQTIRSSIRSYDVVGRVDSNRFAVALVDTAANEAYLWAEKIRKNIAAHVINLDGKSFSVTISVGVCGALEGMKRQELFTHASMVLQRAVETGGNAVRVF